MAARLAVLGNRQGAVRGAKKGKLRPGEKQQLKRARVEAKRAARAVSHHGLDLEDVNQQLREFVDGSEDMLVRLLHA